MFEDRFQLARWTGALCAAVMWLGAAPAAQAQEVATVTPNQPGKGVELHWALDGTEAPISSAIPTSLSVSAPPGFVLNTAAVAKRCTSLNAKLNECPAASKIGTATMTIYVMKPGGPNQLPIPINLYLGANNRLLAVAFLAGVHVVPGSIDGSNGITITFNPLPAPPAIPGVSYQFLGFSLNLGATRTITHIIKRKVKGHGKPKVIRRRHRVYLVQSPPGCSSGSWGLTASVGLPGGTTAQFSAPVPC